MSACAACSTSRRSSRASTATPRPTRPASSSATGRSTSSCRSTAIRARGMKVSQFNMKWVEQAGLVKFDFLGLKTLTVLDLAVRLVKKRGIDLDLSRIPLDDAKSYAPLTKGDTVGIFQLESAGMRRAVIDMKLEPLRRPDRAGRALSPRPDGEHPYLLRAQARQGGARLHPPETGRRAEGDLRRHRPTRSR